MGRSIILIAAAAVALPSFGLAAEPSAVASVKRGDLAALRALVADKVDVNIPEADGTTALHWAVRRDDPAMVTVLLDAGARADTANRYGVTPLVVAATNGNAAIIERLLAAGVDVNSFTGEGETALMIAARTGQVAALRSLLTHGADVHATERLRGQSALMWAAAEGHAAALETLIEAGAEVQQRSHGGFTALLYAIRAGRLAATRVLLAAGANVHDTVQPREGPPGPGTASPSPTPAAVFGPPVQVGPQSGSTDPQLAALYRVFDTGLRGLRTGPSGTSALVLAVINGHFELAAWLVEQGADPDAGAQGWTALHQLAWTRRPPIQHGLPPAQQTGTLDSLTLARRLLEHGANPNARMTREPNDGHRNILNRLGSTPFLNAAKLADVPYMRLLLDYGADASITTDEGATPLMAAAGVGIWHVGESAGSNEEALEAVQLCYEAGNDVNAVDVNGDTALHGAAHRGANEIVRFLVGLGAQLNVPNRIGWTPWIIADGVFYPNTYNRHPETAALLAALGADRSAGRRRQVDLPPSEEAVRRP